MMYNPLHSHSITSISLPIMDKRKNVKNNQEFYLVSELANALRVSHMTIYRYIKAKKIKAYKIGKELRIHKKEFYEFLNRVKTSK